eukprot:scaffold2758_cov26-Tisochrysis_lutea.AAC.1
MRPATFRQTRIPCVHARFHNVSARARACTPMHALQVGFNPIQCEDALRGVLQAQYDAAKMILAQQEEKAHALLADFKSRMQ